MWGQPTDHTAPKDPYPIGTVITMDTNTRQSHERKQWSEVFPPMPTPHSRTACITTEQALVVAGCAAGDNRVDLNIYTYM